MPRAFQHRDGRGQSPSNDTSRGLLPGDRDRGVERAQRSNTGPSVSRRHGSVVRPRNQRRSIFHTKVTKMKLKDSFLRELKFKDRIAYGLLPKNGLYIGEICIRRQRRKLCFGMQCVLRVSPATVLIMDILYCKQRDIFNLCRY